MSFTQVSVTVAPCISFLSDFIIANVLLTAALYNLYVFRWAFKTNLKFLSILLFYLGEKASVNRYSGFKLVMFTVSSL